MSVTTEGQKEQPDAKKPRGEDECSIGLGKTVIVLSGLMILSAIVVQIVIGSITVLLCAITLFVFGVIYMGLGVGAYKLAKKQAGHA